MLRWPVLVLTTALAASCNCGGDTVISCTKDSQCTSGHCVSGKCTSANGGGNGGGTNTGGGNGGGGGGGSTIVTGCDPNATDNATRDTDCDGLSDYDEYNLMYANGAHTDPCNSDTDGDGIQDGTEMGKTSSVSATCTSFVPDSEPGSKTDPTLDDTDGDGLKDGEEDKNHDGAVEPGESNPLKIDSDCDGISDPDEIHGTLGCVTDPLKIDSDDDGLTDGLEQGLQMPGADPGSPPLHCTYLATMFDTDPATKTSACNPDTDGDGIQDGAEDANQNGLVDTGELDPNLMADGTGPAHDACAVANLKPVTFNVGTGSDIQVALVPDFAEVVHISDANGDRGLVFYDAVHQVAGLAIDRKMPTATGLTEEAYGRGVLNTVGALSAPLTQTFTTWDNFATSVRGTYDQAGTADLKARINAIATAFGATTGSLAGSAGITGPFTIQAEYVRRAATRSIIMIAITPSASYTGQTLFTLDDIGGGSALAQYGDYAGVTCEVFDATVNSKVDFLWSVDDSGSMQSSQTAVSLAGSLFATRLTAAGLDWRAAGVSSSYSPGGCSNGCTRAFTNSGPTMTTWFTTGNANVFGTNGNGTEETMASAKKTIQSDLLPSNAAGTGNKIRSDAQLHVLVLGDVYDQSGQSGASLLSFFQNFDGANGAFSKAVVHGIVCPEGQNCGDDTNPTPTSQVTVINGTGGVLADIRTFNVMNPSAAQQAQQQAVIDQIVSAVIGGTGHQLSKPPISSTIKVAIETGGTKGPCNTADIPRSRTDGWDFDSATRRLVFYGNCIPSASGKKVAVSYRFWNDAMTDPGGDPCNNTCTAPQACDPLSATCVCPPMCGGVCTGNTTCNIATCACDPGIG